MSFKRILIYSLLILVALALHAQDDKSKGMHGINLLKNKTHKTIFIPKKAKIKYWLYDSLQATKGRIEKINDSSIVVNGKDIKLEKIRKIGIRNRFTIPLIIVGATGWMIPDAGCYISPLAIIAVIGTNKNYDLIKKWQFLKISKPFVDSSKFKPYEKTIAKRDARANNDTVRTLSFSLNPLNSFFNQHALEIGYQINKKYGVGLGGGFVKADLWWNKNHFLYNGTDDFYPAGVYNGWLMNMYFKRLNINKHHWFFETSLFYKYLWYDHVFFENTFGDPNPYVAWVRSEITNVFGAKFIWGKRIFLSNHFAIEPVFGCSLRWRHRSFITYYHFSLPSYAWGICHRNPIFPGIQAGVLLTFGNFKIK